MNFQNSIFIFIIASILGIFALFYELAFSGPRRKVERLRRRPIGSDRQLPLFQDVPSDWQLHRLLPQSGLATIWEISTEKGNEGRIHVKGKRFTDLITIGDLNGEVRRQVGKFTFGGYVFTFPERRGILRIDPDFSLWQGLRLNFRNLKGEDAFDSIRVQSDGKGRLLLRRGSNQIGVGKLKIGTYPGHAAFSQDCSPLEKVALFYGMLLG